MTEPQLPNADTLRPEDWGAAKLFADIPYNLVGELLEVCQVVELSGGDTLITPGVENHMLYLLLKGHMHVALETADDLTFPIEAGECIGEMSIIEGRPTSAWVIADEDCTLIQMPEKVFWEQYVHYPGAMRNLLQVLSGRMHKNNAEIVRTAQQRLELEHLQRELETAGKIQAGILPKGDPFFPNHPQVDVVASMDPATEVGGDFYDAFALDEDHVYVAIGDVSGKGMPAALFMMQCVSLLRMGMFNEMRVDSVVPQINQVLTESNDGQLFLTLFAAVINVRTGEMDFMNGGHNPPFLQRAGGEFEMIEMPRGTLMGMFHRPEGQYDVGSTVLNPGDTLMIYTDGITEAESASGDFYGEEAALALLNGQKDRSVAEQADALREDVRRFAVGRPPSDDMTVMGVRFLGD